MLNKRTISMILILLILALIGCYFFDQAMARWYEHYQEVQHWCYVSPAPKANGTNYSICGCSAVNYPSREFLEEAGIDYDGPIPGE